jgi:hypothetical protein
MCQALKVVRVNSGASGLEFADLALDTNYFKQGGNSFTALATLGSNDNYGLAFMTNDVERMRITNAGNVGIGTTSPSYKLDVSGGSGIVGQFSGRVIGGNAVNTNEFVTLSQLTSGTGQYWTRTGTNLSPTTAGDDIYLPTNSLLGVGYDPTTFSGAVAAFNGNVGIGTTSPGAKLDISAGNLDLDTTTNANQFGVISKNGTRFIHDFNYGNNGTVTTDGGNTFVGLNAGNLTMGSTATQTYQASYNTALGQASLSSNTTGGDNTASGYASLSSNTTGFSNTASGYASLYSNTTGHQNTASGFASLYSNTTGSNNTASGNESLYSNTTGSNNTASGLASLYYNTTGSNNTASGHASLSSNTTGYQNTASGFASLYSNTTGYQNTASGYVAGRYISGGSGANATSTNSLYLGAFTKALADGDTNEVVLGYDTTGFGSNTVAYGNSSMTKHIFQAGNVGIQTTNPTAALHVPGSTTARASLRVPDGVAPTAPNDGDIWAVSGHLYARLGGVTKEFTLV